MESKYKDKALLFYCFKIKGQINFIAGNSNLYLMLLNLYLMLLNYAYLNLLYKSKRSNSTFYA